MREFITNESTILVECSLYEENSKSVFFFASNGTWSGGLVFYIDDVDIVDWYTKLINYDGKNDIFFKIGENDENWAYYINIWVHPKDSVGHAIISINLIDYQSEDRKFNNGISCNFDIKCDFQQIIDLGECIKKSYLNKSLVKWISKNS